MSQTYHSILVSQDNRGVATITLNRPQVHNAFDELMIAELTGALYHLEQEADVKIIVLKSLGKSFSAGADLQWMQKIANYTLDENIKDAQKLGTLMSTLYRCLKPTVAMVQGGAFGGGVGLVACCQIAIASTQASFCFSEAKLGLIPAVISPYVINAIGLRHARAYSLTAHPFDALSAKQIGLCYDVVSPETLEMRVEEIVALLLQNGPEALKAVNSLLHELQPLEINQAMIDKTVQRIANIRVSPEGQEGLKAFLEKRKPRWSQA